VKKRSPLAAFTLLELLIVIIILGILAALALPQYLRTVEKSRGSEALIHLGTIRTVEMNFYAENRQYTNDWSLLDIDNPNDLPSPPTGTRLFTYSITIPVPGTFTASARRVRADGSEEVITMNENGRITRFSTSGP